MSRSVVRDIRYAMCVRGKREEVKKKMFRETPHPTPLVPNHPAFLFFHLAEDFVASSIRQRIMSGEKENEKKVVAFGPTRGDWRLTSSSSPQTRYKKQLLRIARA